jgi:hypothetical protein
MFLWKLHSETVCILPVLYLSNEFIEYNVTLIIHSCKYVSLKEQHYETVGNLPTLNLSNKSIGKNLLEEP